MGLHLLLALSKLKLALASNGTSPFLFGTLIWPFVLKLSLGFRAFRGGNLSDMAQASSLFLFQLRQIVDDLDRPAAFGDNSRLRRAVRLVWQRLTRVRRPAAEGRDEDSFHTLSMIAL